MSKTVTGDGKPAITHYFRDATGNTMAVYEQEKEGGPWMWKEQGLYGSSRLGMWKPEIEIGDGEIIIVDPGGGGELPPGPLPGGYDETIIGTRQYELTNHLGNVMSTITDMKTGVSINNDDVINYYLADVITAGDYYPGGMEMPGRKYQAGTTSYRYGFGGMEKSDEIKGEGNSYTASYWEYDPRLVRRWNVDPLAHQFPWMSPYAAMNDNPIKFTDPTGMAPESIHIDPKGNVLLNKDDGDNTVYVHAAAITTKDVEKAYTTSDHSAGGINVGKLGGNIKSGIISQIFKENKKEAGSLPNEAEWVARVLPNAQWDYKNNEKTIFGVAWAFDEDNKAKTGSETKTSFTDDVLQGNPTWASAADFGNFNAGYTGIYAKVPILRQYKWAGAGELLKGHPDAANRLNQWMQNIAPYGDNLRDYHFNTFGMQAAFKEMSTGILKF